MRLSTELDKAAARLGVTRNVTGPDLSPEKKHNDAVSERRSAIRNKQPIKR